MDFQLTNEKKKQISFESRWDRIEKRQQLNAIELGHNNDITATICRNLIENTNDIKQHHMKALMGDESKQFYLDPNLVMDLRHSKTKKAPKVVQPVEPKIKSRNAMDEREQYLRMMNIDKEIDQFKETLENIRPRSLKVNGVNDVSHLKDIVEYSPNIIVHVDPPFDILRKELPFLNMPFNIPKINKCPYSLTNSVEFEPMSITECPDSPEKDNSCEERESSSESDRKSNNNVKCFGDYKSPKSIVNTDLKVTVQPKSTPEATNEDIELVIRPTFTFNVHENRANVRVDSNHKNCSSETNSNNTNSIDHKISLDQHMSILIRKLDINQENSTTLNSEWHDGNGDCLKSTERNIIINELFRKNPQNDFVVLQKYFLRWVHYTTIEKLMRRNPEQTRLKKMEAFLQNIRLERKRTLNKLRQNASEKKNEPKKLFPLQVDSPRLLARKYNNKIKVQQDIIELQKLKLQRQERIIAELKCTKLLEDTMESEIDLKSDLRFVAQAGCPNSRSKARCLQIAGNLKDPEDDKRAEKLLAKGLMAPKFLIEMQARALEREMRHQRAHQRRTHLEKEKETMRLAAEESKRVLDEQGKRDRIVELRRKRREEKELKAQKEMERLKFLADMERAKQFNRTRLLKIAMKKFHNIVDWKKRNENVSNKFRRRLLCRKIFNKWQNLVKKMWCERKSRADLCYNRHCLAVGWSLWQKYYLIEHSKKLLADDWFDMKLTEKAFRAWNCFTAQRRMIYEIKQRQAETHYNWCLKWRALEQWRRLHAILMIERETESRRARWRNKIHELVPDYTPNAMDYKPKF